MCMRRAMSCLRDVALSGFLSSHHRWPWQWQRHAVSEDRRALRLRVRLSGGVAEEEDDPQRHQQQEMEPDRKDHHQRRTSSTGTELCTGTEEGAGRRVIGYKSQLTGKKAMKNCKVKWLTVLVCGVSGRLSEFRAEREKDAMSLWHTISFCRRVKSNIHCLLLF